MSILELNNVTKSYGDVSVLSNVCLSIDRGEAVGIVGPSGSGKTTLLNLMSTLDEGSSGELVFDGERISDRWLSTRQSVHSQSLWQRILAWPRDTYLRMKRERGNARIRLQIGFVFQSAWMLSNFDVASNIELASWITGHAVPADEQLAEMLGELGLRGREKNTADMLSGGERQRAAMGRALFHDPAIVFADEPTGNLDPVKAVEMMTLLSASCRRRGAALVLVTHHPVLAARFTDRVIGIKQGRIAWEQANATEEQVNAFLHQRDAAPVELFRNEVHTADMVPLDEMR